MIYYYIRRCSSIERIQFMCLSIAGANNALTVAVSDTHFCDKHYVHSENVWLVYTIKKEYCKKSECLERVSGSKDI